MNWVREVKDQVVRNMMDRHFMLNQQIVVMGQHERKVNRRIEEREVFHPSKDVTTIASIIEARIIYSSRGSVLRNKSENRP
ncbi:hypothetical protein J6590_005749 [Homalodisca vitripennis]|nr:hypothetical protein J6590_005749 [Homalodisca vitripennis]